MPHPLLAFALILDFTISDARFENICPYDGQYQYAIARTLRVAPGSVPEIAGYICDNVGRRAYNAVGSDRMRSIFLGPILGVAWMNAGEVISLPGEARRRAPVSGFMYIIGPGGVAGYSFLRWHSDIVGR